ncbi:efflux RND transporter periplasmic adaptor subunit [Thioclava sp. FR2]|uniref:efflux RND transporter periplasmic adaptor subunit n=1 Tax=Thioclava sp. FR2 TaxID=3445780 RepID=UPI003EBC5275
MRHLISIAAFIATCAVLVWVFLPDPVPVETAPITRGDVTVRVEAEGEARVREVVVISAPITGLLQRVTLHPGDAVTAGQVLAQIGPVTPALLDSRARAVAESTAAAAAAAVELARSQLVQAEASLTFARAEADRTRALFERAALSQRMLDDAVLAERTAEATLASARANLAVREKELDSAKAMLNGDYAEDTACCIHVTSPVTGRILGVRTEDEQVLQAGTPIMEVGDLQDLEIMVSVLSREAVNIAEGAEATITGWGGPDLAARVERVEPGATTKISALGIEEQRVEVRLSLLAPAPPALGHGFRVTARITIDMAQNILRVPVSALFRSKGDWAVYSVEDGKAALQIVSLGRRNDEFAEVLDGLTEGATVIVHPADTVENGSAVEEKPLIGG